VPVRVGNQVSTQTVLTTIDQNETLEVYVPVPIERASALPKRTAHPAPRADRREPTGDDRGGLHLAAVDDQTQSVLVKGQVRNADGRLRSAQYVRAARIVWKTAEGLVVPVTAALRISGQFFAFVAEDAGGKLVARQRAIKVGPIAGNNYPVLDGMQARRPRRRLGRAEARRRRTHSSDGCSQPPASPRNCVLRHLHPSSDSGERVLARDHPRWRHRHPDAADRPVPELARRRSRWGVLQRRERRDGGVRGHAAARTGGSTASKACST